MPCKYYSNLHFIVLASAKPQPATMKKPHSIFRVLWGG